MPFSKTKRAINFLIFAGFFAFVNHFSDQAFQQIDKASSAIERIQAGGR